MEAQEKKEVVKAIMSREVIHGQGSDVNDGWGDGSPITQRDEIGLWVKPFDKDAG
jgi:hypothetical protein